MRTSYPRIAIRRIGVLLESASALYGSLAIAGVVNRIPYWSFDGFKVQRERRHTRGTSAPSIQR